MIRIFVGCSANGEDAEAQGMLEYTLRRYATAPLDITWMKLSRDPQSPWYSNPAKKEGWNTATWATPFSAFRWAIPYVCKFEGKAIYMDVDKLARANIVNLNDQEHPEGKPLLMKDSKHTCVILFDCSKLKAAMPPLHTLMSVEGYYRKVRTDMARLTAYFEGNWNCLDGENYKTLTDNDIKIIHFTRVETQPHLKWALPRLHAEGRKHWGEYSGRKMGLPHARPDVGPMVERIWKEAQEAGYGIEKYLPKPEEMFGRYDAVRGASRAA